MSSNRPLYGLVLAGGRSSRMGTDKAALPHPDGLPLARRTHDLLAEAGCGSIVLSLRHDQEIPPGFNELPDTIIARDPEGESEGPLAGMLASMRLRPDGDWLILACDLPRLDVKTLAYLISSRLPDEPFLSYLSEFDGLPEPLCAFYAAEALPILERARTEGFRCPRKVLIRNNCRLLPPVTPRALDNANTPDDWQSATAPMAVTYQISYFGMLAERRGLADEQLVCSAATPADLYQNLDAKYGLGLVVSDLRAAVNDEFVSWNHPLKNGDRIAFLPPMSGG